MVFSSSKLLNASKRIVVPKPFDVYIKLIENSTGRKFPTGLEFTKDEVISSDEEALKTFSEPNFYLRDLNFNLLFESCLCASEDVGFYHSLNTTISPTVSATSYPSKSSSGWPYFRPKGESEPISDAVKWCSNYISSPTITEILKQPTAAFHRFQYKVSSVSDDAVNSVVKKIRLIWGVSFRISTLEGVFLKNLTQNCANFQLTRTFPFVAQGLTNSQISDRVISSMRNRFHTVYSMDVKSFDSNIPTYAWSLFHTFLDTALEIPDNMRQSFENLQIFYAYTPYVYMSTELKFQRKGIPSGSLITSLFGSWWSRVIVNYAFLESTGQRAGDRCCVLGDDNLVCGDFFSRQYLTSVYLKFGMPINVEKSGEYSTSEDFPFLGRFWDTDNAPYETENWYIAHLALPSRFYTKLPIPVSLMQTYRGISLCMSLRDGVREFERLVGYGDKVWLDLKREYSLNRSDPIIRYISEEAGTFLLGFPLSRILTGNWRLF